MTNLICAPTLNDALRALTSLVEESEGRGDRITVFCEDKLTLLAEKASVLRSKGTFLTEVTTFARFLKGDRAILSKQGSVMAISSILREHEGELGCFKRSAAQAVYETIAQLLSSKVDPKTLKCSADETEGMLSRKLTDLALVLEKYEEFLRKRELVDENGYLSLLPEKISETLAGRHVVFFAFPSFTRQAMEGVRAALLAAKHVTGVFLSGEAPAYTNEAAELFRTAAEECGEVQVTDLPSSLEGDAAFLAARLFSPDAYGEKPEKRKIRLFRAADEGSETETVCALIRKYVAERGLRFRDFAVLLPDKDRFMQTERIFADFRIPFFSDRKRPLSEHPFCRFVFDLLACVHDGGTGNSVDAALSSVYFGEADDLRNYLLKFGGYRGAVNRSIKDCAKGYDREALEGARARLRACIALFPREGKGKKYTSAVRSLYALVGGEERTETLSAKFEGAEKEFLDLARLEEFLCEVERIAGEETFTAKEFSDLLKSGLSSLEVAMIPQSADAVFLGDATESRSERVAVLFLLGADESLPRVSNDTAVITDGEIKRLKALSLEIEPQIGVVNARARESLYLNLCSFKNALFIGCPLRVKGEEARRGEAFLSVSRMCERTPLPDISLYLAAERGPALRALFRLSEGYRMGETDSAELFLSLKTLLGETGDGALLGRFLGGRGKRAEKLPSLLFRGQISPSLLETYFECPYKSFFSYGLRIREREERSALDTDTGSFVHKVLEMLAPKFGELENEETCRALAEETARALLSDPAYAFMTDTGAGAYTGARLEKECGAVTAACFRQLRGSAFRVEASEKEISLPALNLYGKADRVDVSDGYVRIIDYKTGEIDDKPSAYYTGRKLQLELYLLAASEGKTPVGAFYFPAREEFADDDGPLYRMKGFFVKDDEVLSRMDTERTAGESAFYEGGKERSARGLPQGEFEDFLGYSLLVAEQAVKEMEQGNVAPSPFVSACDWCKFKGACGFSGDARKGASRVTCAQIAAVSKAERGEK